MTCHATFTFEFLHTYSAIVWPVLLLRDLADQKDKDMHVFDIAYIHIWSQDSLWLQEIMTEFLIETMHRAMAASALKGGRPSVEDVMFLVRKVRMSTALGVAVRSSAMCEAEASTVVAQYTTFYTG